MINYPPGLHELKYFLCNIEEKYSSGHQAIFAQTYTARPLVHLRNTSQFLSLNHCESHDKKKIKKIETGKSGSCPRYLCYNHRKDAKS